MSDGGLQADAREALQKSIAFSFDHQKPDGHWVAEVSADVSFTSEYVMFKYAMGFDLKSDGAALRRWLLHTQKDDGSWALAPTLPGNVSTTVEAYLALKILGVSPDEPNMLRTRDFMVKNGGVVKVRFFTRFFLATFGLFPWTAIPQMPAELILMPPSAPLNIYTLCSWARSTLIPILIVRHHEPVYALPNGQSSDNDFLDELWCAPNNKNVPFAPPLSKQLWEQDFIGFAFTAIEKFLGSLGGLKHFPLRTRSRKACIDWLLEHQEKTGEWAGFFPPMHGSIWALILEGFPLDHKAVRLGLEALERLAFESVEGKRIAATVSPVWDTALMLSALCDASVSGDPRVQKSVDWVKSRQILSEYGDWRVYGPNSAGGWSFEYHNTFYPDVDDTAVVIMALVKHDPPLIGSECISMAVQWILGMQNSDGGWGAFDHENNQLWLHKIPFSDMDSLCDPSSADITGRVLECWGFMLSHRKGSWDPKLQQQVKTSSERGIRYILEEQEACGGWWGRWGNNYIYGTSNVLRGLVHFAHTSADVRACVERATEWFESCQNADGGWGEHLKTYDYPELAGQGNSTAAQTSWALLSLQPYRPRSYPAVERGIRWLVHHQNVASEHGMSWDSNMYTATGFPKVLYLGYPYYHHYFAIVALAKYLDGDEQNRLQPITVPLQVSRVLNRPSILFMVVGSRGDIQVFLNVAKILANAYRYRVRIATHPVHRKLVEDQGIEFYSVNGDPAEFSEAFTKKPNILLSTIKGDFVALWRMFHVMIASFWQSSYDNPARSEKDGKRPPRPFIADTIVSSLPTLTHIHCAEKLGVPLVLVSVQPLLPTSSFPQVFTMTKPTFSPNHWWNYISYLCLDLLNWLAFGPYLNYLRVSVYRLKPASWAWAAFEFPSMRIPHLCLWSPNLIPRPREWNEEVVIAGYTHQHEKGYVPPRELESFLDTDEPTLAIGFGSASIANPTELMTTVFSAIERIGAKAVVCLNGQNISSTVTIPDKVCIVEEVPHDWLLSRVQGFVHHGGAGHTAAGLRAGVPMLIIPFFLDQNLWAANVGRLELGPAPIAHQKLTTGGLASSLQDLLSSKYRARCAAMAAVIKSEKDGAEIAAGKVAGLQIAPDTQPPCAIVTGLKARWRHVDSGLLLSGVAAAYLVTNDVLNWIDLEPECGLDWADRLNGKSNDIIASLAKLTDLLYRLFRLVHAILSWVVSIGGTRVDRDDDLVIKARDPVYQSRIKQAEHDMQFVKRAITESDANEPIGDQIISNWQVLSAAAFHGKFKNGVTRA